MRREGGRRSGIHGGDEDPNSAAAAVTMLEPEIQEAQDMQMDSKSSPAGQDSAGDDRSALSYVDAPAATLRRRPRSSKLSDEGGSNSLESGATSYAHSQSEDHGRNRRPNFADDRKGKSPIQEEQIGGTLARAETADGESSVRTEEPVFHSGSDSELDDGDGASSDSSKEGDDQRVVADAGRESAAVEEGMKREVYRMPDSDVEEQQLGDGTSLPFLSWPAGLLVQAIGFQVKLCVHAVALAVWLFDIACSLIYSPINHTLQAKERAQGMATGAVNQGIGMMSQVREGVALTGSLVSRVSRKTAWGCLGSAYVLLVLSLLLIPAFLLDLVVVSRIVEEPVEIRETLQFDYTQARPSALVFLLSPQELVRAQTLSPEKLGTVRRIPAGYKYQVDVVLTMPESDYNIRLGMFQVTAEMLTARDQVLMRQSKPCMLPYRSPLVRVVRTMLHILPNLLGLWSEAQTLEIHVLQAQEKAIPTASLKILLEPKAGYSYGGGLPELYDAELVLRSTLPWSKATIRRWKWTLYVWNGVCLFLFEIAVVLCCCRKVLIPSSWHGAKSHETIVVGEAVVARRPARADSKKQRRKRHVSFEDGLPDAPGDSASSTIAPSDPDGPRSSVVADSEHHCAGDTDFLWPVPPLEETLRKVEEGVTVMGETVKTLGETLVGGVAEGLGQAFDDVATSRNAERS